MRKIVLIVMTLLLTSISTAATSATTTSSVVKISEVDCNNEWVEVINTHSSLSINLKNFSLLIIETDGGELQDTYTFPSIILKPGKTKAFDELAIGFGIGCGEESVLLQDTKGKELDRVAVPNLLDEVSWSRFGSVWAGGIPSKGKTNIPMDAEVPIDQAAWIFDQFQSFRINITIAPEYLDPNNPNGLIQKPKVYVPATFRFRDANNVLLPTTGALSVGVRTKGSVGQLMVAR